MPRRLADPDLRRHVGARFAKRARRSRVENPVAEGNTLLGRVGLYDVRVTVVEGMESHCGCIYGGRCEHVGALLAAWIDEPSQFTQRAGAVELPVDPGALRRWLAEHDSTFLGASIDNFIDRGRWMSPRHPLWSAGHRELDVALDILALAVERGELSAEEATRPVHASLSDAVRARRRRRRGLRRASRWRETLPEEPALQALWTSARSYLDAELLSSRPPGSFGRVEILPNQDLRFQLAALPYHPLSTPLTDHLLEDLPARLVREVAGIVLDSIVGEHQLDVRREVLAILKVPAWERALLQLDQALALEGPKSASSIGWRLRITGAVVEEIGLVSLTPFKRKAGFRAKKLSGVVPTELPLPSDRASLALQAAKQPVALVLEQLVGHPRLIDDQGQPIRVRRSELEVAVDQGSSYGLRVLVDGQSLLPNQLSALLGAAGVGVLHIGGVIHLVAVGPVLEALVGVLHRFGSTFPAEARGPLMDRLGILDKTVPLRLQGELRGERVPGDWRPVLLLEPLRDGALNVVVRLEPIEGGGMVVPGQGAGELAHTHEGRRRFVVRDLEAEGAAVQRVLKTLPLPTLVDWSGTHELPERALELVWTLRKREDVRSLWPKRRMLLSGEAKASQVRASAQRRRDWFGLEGELRAGKSIVGLKDLLFAIRAGQRFVQLDDGSWIRLADGLRRALRTAAEIGTHEEVVRLPPLAAARAMLALEEAGGDALAPEELTDLGARIRAADGLEARPTPGLRADLRDYQLQGVTWLRRLSSWAPGAVLADEMGLGKTLQALALVLERGGRTLVVAPASVNLNWQREAAKFAPGLAVGLYRGAHRKKLLEADTGVLITSYELLVRDLDDLCRRRFETVIFDEAQALKNPRTKRARAARALDIGFTLALTGTPIENNLLELWSLMRVTVPGLLGPKEHFHQRFGKKQMRARSMGDGKLGALVRPFLLRRSKKVVAPELPERTETIDWIELSTRERVVYEQLRLAAVSALKVDDSPDRIAVLAALTRLRQAACSERLLHPDAPPESSKIRRMLERIEEVLANKGALLIFSQFTSLLELAQEAVEKRGIRSVRLDGSTSLVRRQEAVDRFQAGEAEVFFISLKAGGTGLNLTAANTVIHLDPWWNPAAEDQASDRAHRIGQTRAVQVIRLVSAGTVEEQVLQLHEEKRRLAEMLFEGTAGSLEMKADDLLRLLDA